MPCCGRPSVPLVMAGATCFSCVLEAASTLRAVRQRAAQAASPRYTMPCLLSARDGQIERCVALVVCQGFSIRGDRSCGAGVPAHGGYQVCDASDEDRWHVPHRCALRGSNTILRPFPANLQQFVPPRQLAPRRSAGHTLRAACAHAPFLLTRCLLLVLFGLGSNKATHESLSA